MVALTITVAVALLMLLAVLVYAVRLRIKSLVIICAVLACGVVLAGAAAYPVVSSDAEKTVAMDTRYVLTVDGEPSLPEDSKIDPLDWLQPAEGPDGEPAVRLLLAEGDTRELVVPLEDAVFTNYATAWWDSDEGERLADIISWDPRPRVTEVTCSYTDFVARLLLGPCQVDERRWAVQVPGGELYEDPRRVPAD